MRSTRPGELIALASASLVVFFVVAEVTLRFYLERHTFYDVEMSRYARALKVDSPNPLIGHLHKPNHEVRLMDVSVRINSDGFRDDEYPIAKGQRRRILFLGDSLTFGWGVEKEETFEHLLEGMLSTYVPTEIINLGTGNYNTTQEVHLFIEKGLKYDPDQVVVFYFINDAEPAPQKSRFPWLGDFRIVTFYWSRIKALAARMSASPDFREYYSALYRGTQEGWSNSKAAFLKLQEVCRDRGIDLRVVLLPELHQLRDYTFAEEHARISGFLRENNIPVLDLAPSFRNEENPRMLWVSGDDAHPNARAHHLIAERTLDFLRMDAPPRKESGS